MTLFVLAYLAGVLTIVSPCILPVLPFVLARVGQPFRRSGLPMLVGDGARVRRGGEPRGIRRQLGDRTEPLRSRSSPWD